MAAVRSALVEDTETFVSQLLVSYTVLKDTQRLFFTYDLKQLSSLKEALICTMTFNTSST